MGSIKIVFKHMPLRMHKNAKPAAMASIAAQKQGKFWEYHDELFLHSRSLTPDTFTKIAEQINLDMTMFNKDMNSPDSRKRVEQDMKDAKNAGVTGTPAIFINGRKLKKRNAAAAQKIIDEELANSRKNQ